MKPMDFKGRWVLVTGASSGLGRDIARTLAHEHGANLVVVARREARLLELKTELEATAGVQVTCLTADLSRAEDVEKIFHEATTNHPVHGVVLNAGVTHFGPYEELSWVDFQSMLMINVTSVVRLTTLFLPYLEESNQGGGLMLVSSLAGLTPVPYQTHYSGTKAFLVHFGCGLYHETIDRNVSVTVVVPGGIATEMTSTDRFNRLGGWLITSERCAREAVAAFVTRKDLYVPSVSMRLGAALMRFVPRRFLTSRVASVYRKALVGATVRYPE